MTQQPFVSSQWCRERKMFRTLAVATTIFALTAVIAHEYLSSVVYGLLAALGCAGYLVSLGGCDGYRDGFCGGFHEGTASELARAEAREHELAELLAACDLNIEDTVPDQDEGYIYVLKFSTGTVKPGQTRNLRRRFAEHRRAAEAYNVAICDYWVSQPHTNYLDNELQLIAFCDELASRSKREYFHGLDFDKAVEFALGLTFLVADPAVEVVPS